MPGPGGPGNVSQRIHIPGRIVRKLNPAAGRAGFSNKQYTDLIGFIGGKIKRCVPRERVFEALAPAIEAAASAKLNATQNYTFIKQIAEKFTRPEELARMYRSLSVAFEAVAQQQFAPNQTLDFFGEILNLECGPKGFYALPDAFKAGLSPKEVLDLYGKFKEELEAIGMWGERAWAFIALEDVLKYKLNLTFDQIVEILGRVMENAVEGFKGTTVCAAPKALKASLEAGIEVDQIKDFLGRAASFREAALVVIPGVLRLQFTPDQILELFDEIVKSKEFLNNVDSWSYTFVRKDLPHEAAIQAKTEAFKAGLSPKQTIDFFWAIVDKDKVAFRGDITWRKNALIAFAVALGSASEAGQRPSQILSRLKGIIKTSFKHNLIDSFNAASNEFKVS
ncbi:hypothetical protein AMJ44_13245 [candidate division WOR-1 bacterium DG_54_3]|uniref:Uncharacterized protein n=1 Tax=candidate division WOR-1 bacterium DG_54_3 TaxID=1703775 RepID=A0A0S7XNV4_UNCSA|nr:MAG: hypothetical protein AMJ44_13245 [candidate division WOR-1 bacterium DG_54_3]